MSHLLRFIFAIIVAGSLSLTARAGETLPFISPLNTAEDFARWTAVDVDGNVQGEKATWFLGNTDMGGTCATSWIDVAGHQPSDHLLVSPALTLEQGVSYVLKFSYYTSYYNDEDLSVYLSPTPELAEDAEPLERMTLNSYYGGKKSIMVPQQAQTGDCYLILRHVSDGVKGMIVGIKDLSVGPVQEGAAEGHTYTYVNGNKTPVEGMKVIYTGPNVYTAVSDAEGYYHIDNIAAADYVVTYEKHGYEAPSYRYTVTVDPMSTVTYDITAYQMKVNTVKGTVVDNAGNPISGARISLSGYDQYAGVSMSDGTFSIAGVLMDGGYNASVYRMEVAKNGFAAVAQELSISPYTDFATGDVALTYKALAPETIEATAADGTANVVWKAPFDATTVAYDNGSPGRPSGYDSGSEYNILGTVVRTPMDLKKVRWYRMSADYASEPPSDVILYIIALDADGNPDPQQFLYSNMAVPSPVDAWTEFELPTTVSAPNGCLVALSCKGYLSLAIDDSGELPPAGTQCYSSSYLGGYVFFEDVDWKGACMIRVEGQIMEDEGFQPARTYSLYRFEEAARETPENWTLLVGNTTATTYADAEYATLDRGNYCYAVEAHYAVDALTSQPVISSPLFIGQHTVLTLLVTADSDPADADGARVFLTDGSGHDYSATVADGQAVIANVWKNTYTVTVEQEGFTSDAATFDLSLDGQYTKTLHLKQIIRPVRNIDVVAGEDGSYTLLWDVFADIFDDFEGDDHTDFEIHPAGAAGWSYIDNDLFRTYGFGATTFPGMGSPMAAILFNAEGTTPPLAVNPAYSGSRCLAFFAAYPTETSDGTMLNTSDDYLISPRLDFHKDFTFSFRARTYEAQEGRLERIRVGYSTTTPDLDRFTYVTDGYISVPEGDAQAYTFTLPAEARYVTLNSSSDDVFLLAVDDVSISSGIPHSGLPASAGHFLGYHVYIDGVLVATQEGNSLRLSNLDDGTHTAEVSKVFAGGESERLAVTFSTLTGIADITTDTPEGKPTYYNLHGQRVRRPQHGQILLRRQGTGVEKVVVR